MAREIRHKGSYFEMPAAPYRMAQGDIFDGVVWPSIPDAIAYRDTESGEQVYLPGAYSFRMAMLITAGPSLWPEDGSQGVFAATLVPIEPMAGLLAPEGPLQVSDFGLAQEYDSLLNYMYLPADVTRGIPEGMAELFQPFCLHREVIEGQCIARLTYPARQQLQRKLAAFWSNRSLARGTFTP